MRREVCFLIGPRDTILWADASTSPVALPDSVARWHAIWDRREELVEIAHSHPVGPLGFSREDETTMEALTSALGKSLRYSVVAPTGRILRDRGEEKILSGAQPYWVDLLKAASGME
jgi:hypothetical protein